MLGEGVDDRRPNNWSTPLSYPALLVRRGPWLIGTSDMGSQSAELSQHQWIRRIWGVSPGGVGFDINCGVRLLSTGLSAASTDIRHHRQPSEVSTRRSVIEGRVQLSSTNLDDILSGGAQAASEMGLGSHADLDGWS